MRKRRDELFIIFAAAALCAFEPADVKEVNCSAAGPVKADCAAQRAAGAGQVRNLVLLIGDGMGIGQTYAGRVYLYGPEGRLAFENFPHQGLVTTCSLGAITDSAAAATAMGSGNKTNNGELGLGPGPQYEFFPNVIDLIHKSKAVGVVTTSMVWDATPAGFTVHARSRQSDRNIARALIEDSRPEVIMGGGAKAFQSCGKERENLLEKARASGYAVVQDRHELASLDTETVTRILGLFAPQKMEYENERSPDCPEPRLSDMARVSLAILDNDPRGFFLMIEGGRIDHASHAMNLALVVGEVVEFNRTVEVVMEWAQERGDTLVLVTADHETGGTRVKAGPYQKGDLVRVDWTRGIPPFSAGHSSQLVPLYAQGPYAEAVQPQMDNTDIFCLIMNALQ
jgi:alkaline phosphatase